MMVFYFLALFGNKPLQLTFPIIIQSFLYQKSMSFFLLPQSLFYPILQQKQGKQQQTYIQQKSFEITYSLHQSLQLAIDNTLKVLPSSFREDSTQRQWAFFLGDISLNFKTLLHMSFSKLQPKLRLSLSILNNQQSFFKINNSARLTEISNKVNHFVAKYGLHIVKVAFNTSNNKIDIQLPFLLLSNNLLKSHMKSIHKMCTKVLRPLFFFIISCSNEVESDISYLQGEQYSILSQLNKYSHIFHTPTHFCSQEQIYHQKKSSKDIESVKKDRVQLDACFTLPHQLMATTPFSASQNYRPSLQQLRFIQRTIDIKYNIKQKPEDTTINLIYLNDMSSIKLTKFDQGGFCSIFKADINYHTVANSNQSIKKTVVFKNGDGKDGFSRNQHQAAILKTLKNARTVFLPKYYLIANKPNPYFKSIVMDYISPRNLKDYLRLHSRYMSLHTKLTIILGVVQSLRFLQTHRIAHLDLKPNNIMICSKLHVKIIDFGESYHHSVCSKTNYQPGYTIPYSPPQIFSNNKQFTSKSDVFSLGVIMFQILYNAYPFDVFQDTHKIDDIMQAFLKKCFFCPEWLETFGDMHIMRILNIIICKCLAYDASARPQLDWLAFTVRQCLNITN